MDAETIYKDQWISSVGYCLPTTKLTDKQENYIQKPFCNAIQPKMGFNMNFSRAVIFGTTKYQGK